MGHEIKPNKQPLTVLELQASLDILKHINGTTERQIQSLEKVLKSLQSRGHKLIRIDWVLRELDF